MWADIDYMDNYKDFTVGSSWDGYKAFLDKIHGEQRYFVPIVDAGIAYKSSAYSDASKSNFIKSPDGYVYYGKVWPGKSAFPDWFEKSTTEYWTKQLALFYQKMPFDGLWNDMNEISNF